jgi:hypothetical protein
MNKLVFLVVSFLCTLPVSAQTTQTIKKCQDAEGNWHYGDHAAFECEQSSRVTEMDEGGGTVGETEAPPSQEELDARQRAEQQAAEQDIVEAKQRRLDQKLLITYDNADSIATIRDALMAAMDSGIEANQDLKQRLVDVLDKIEAGSELAESLRREIAVFDDDTQDRLTKRELIRKKYNEEYERYKELTGN